MTFVPPDEADFIDDMKKLLGLAPYNSPANICWNDNYFYRYLISHYGEERVKKADAKLRKAS